MDYAYRGENGPVGSKSGRTPEQVQAAGGFRPWRADSLEQARDNLRRLVASGTLTTEAEAWCLLKDRKNGWFFSTGLDAGTAYDNYQYFYRFSIAALQERPWSVAGDKPVKGMKLYLDAPDLDDAGMIAVIWQVRKQELLVMSPVDADAIGIRNDGVWQPLVAV